MIDWDSFCKSFPLARQRDLEKYYPYLQQAMHAFEIDTPNRIAFFLAQTAHESGNFYYVEEIASGRAYEKRADLGNLKPDAIAAANAKGTTPGRWYKGHGLIQITGYYNHKACGEALRLDLVNDPRLLMLPEHAVRSACWFFATHGCNRLADENDFKACTRRINGGFNGLSDRVKHLNNVIQAMKN